MNIERAAEKFAKGFREELTFSKLKQYTEKNLHYKVLFIDSLIGEREIKKLGIKIPRTEKAITVNSAGSSIVFIKGSLCEDDKIQCLLHECGHIVLGHMDIPALEIENRKCERQAELFSYLVLSNIKRRIIMRRTVKHFLIAVLCMLAVFLTLHITGIKKDAEQPLAIQTFAATSDNNSQSKAEQSVYITKYGTKYHASDCRYVKGKNNLTQTSRQQAEKTHTPCKICNP